jgi:hypothetical protein
MIIVSSSARLYAAYLSSGLLIHPLKFGNRMDDLLLVFAHTGVVIHVLSFGTPSHCRSRFVIVKVCGDRDL